MSEVRSPMSDVKSLCRNRSLDLLIKSLQSGTTVILSVAKNLDLG